MSINGPKKIIIAGAGFAGVKVALDLKKIARNNEITLINDTPYHCYQPELYQLVASHICDEKKDEFHSLENTVNIPLQEIFQGTNIKILIEKILKIDLEEKNVKTEKGKLEYDFLVLCLGSKTNYFGIPGAEDFSHPLKNSGDALNIRDDIEEKVLRDDRDIEIIIAGGGFTGVELAGSLAELLKHLKKHNSRKAQVTILEGSKSLLPGMPEWAQNTALVTLKKIGVEISLNHQISNVSKNKIECTDGSIFNFDYLIWTTGVRGENLNGGIIGVEFNRKSQIEVQPDLSLRQFSDVFVLGDLAAVLDQRRNAPVPQAAWAAVGEAETVAENIKRLLKGLKTISYYSQEPIFIVPVGKLFALSNLWFLHVSGVVGWLLKRFVSLKYFLSILPLFQAFRLWIKGARFYVTSEMEK